MGNCEFKVIGTDLYQCTVCGQKIRSTRPNIMAACRDGNTANPISTYAKALAKWNAAGRPTRDDDEVERIFTICKSCDKFDPKRKKCKLCTCRLNLGKFAPLNKIRMATESCPDDPPKWG